MTVRRRGRSTTFAAGAVVGVDELDALLRGTAGSATDDGPAPAPGPAAGSEADADVRPDAPAASLRAAADEAREAFEQALAARDVEGCVGAVLGLEQAVHEWSTDMLQSDDTDVARRTLRSLVVRLGELAATGARDPREVLSPYVDLLVEVRGAARAGKDFATSDLVRDRLAAAGVEVRDTPDGATWQLRSDGGQVQHQG